MKKLINRIKNSKLFWKKVNLEESNLDESISFKIISSSVKPINSILKLEKIVLLKNKFSNKIKLVYTFKSSEL